MDSTNDCNATLSHEPLSVVAPPPSPLHEAANMSDGSSTTTKRTRIVSNTKSRWDTLGKREARLADQLSSSLATIAREERRRIGYVRGDASSSFGGGFKSRGESDDGGEGDVSEESWASFVGRQSSSGPAVVTATAASSSDDRYSSGGAERKRAPTAGGETSAARTAAAMPQQHAPYHGVIHHHQHRHVSEGVRHGLQVAADDKVHHLVPTGMTDDRRASIVKMQHSAKRTQFAITDPVLRTRDERIPKVARLERASTDDLESGESSSGSGTDGGYDGCASSSDNMMQWSSPSVSSSEEGQQEASSRHRHRQFIGFRHAKKMARRSDSSVSSELPDFSSSSSSSSAEARHARSKHASLPAAHRRNRARHEQQHFEPPPFASLASGKMLMATQRKHQYRHRPSVHRALALKRPAAGLKSEQPPEGQAPLFVIGCDIMAHVVTYLEPVEVQSVLTLPISKQWRSSYTVPQDLWRILCHMEPFKAQFGPEDMEGDSSDDSFPKHVGLNVNHTLGRYRLLYTSFIRCVRYLAQIKDDAVHGRSPSVIDYGGADIGSLSSNSSLKNFLSKARRVVKRQRTDGSSSSSSRSTSPFAGEEAAHVGVTDDSSSVESGPRRKKSKTEEAAAAQTSNNKVRFGHSKLTQRLLGPSKEGEPGSVNLPWSCAIYSIVNWMVAFSDVEGIQTMCLSVLPFLLEDEGQRTTAQRAGLTDIVLRGMVLFPDSVALHTAAFHTIVLLARPLGGKEGMLFHSSMVNSSGIFNDGSPEGKNGIAVMLDSMRRFDQEDILQAMSCWSLVNIALAPSQKAMLVRLGGIAATANAMVQHPYNAEVQFRALFALINLVIPSVGPSNEATGRSSPQEQVGGETSQSVEKDTLDQSVEQIASLVVVAMKHFCSSESILNRACLVLHNLSLTTEYHAALLWTPCCYQMLEWCLANYRTDQVLQQSAAGTLHRLQQTLSNNDELRHQFTSFLQSQQQQSLEQAHEEAVLLHEQQEQLLAAQQQRQNDA